MGRTINHALSDAFGRHWAANSVHCSGDKLIMHGDATRGRSLIIDRGGGRWAVSEGGAGAGAVTIRRHFD